MTARSTNVVLPATWAILLVLTTWAISINTSIGGEVSGPKSQTKKDTVNHPVGCVAVRQEKSGPVHFEVYLVDPSTGRLVPISAHRVSVEILGKQPPVWETKGEDYSTAHQITYGVTPKGFQDLVPPEQLLLGISYTVNVRSFAVGGIQRIFLHEGAGKTNTCPWDGNPQS